MRLNIFASILFRPSRKHLTMSEHNFFLIVRFNAIRNYTWARRCAVVEGYGLIPTSCASSTCAEMSTHAGVFAFRLRLKSGRSGRNLNPRHWVQQQNACSHWCIPRTGRVDRACKLREFNPGRQTRKVCVRAVERQSSRQCSANEASPRKCERVAVTLLYLTSL